MHLYQIRVCDLLIQLDADLSSIAQVATFEESYFSAFVYSAAASKYFPFLKATLPSPFNFAAISSAMLPKHVNYLLPI